MSSKLMGPFLIAIAALLWATDALFRLPTMSELTPTFIVLMEHLICVLVLLPWMFFKMRKELFKLSFTEWSASALIGIGGSAAATIFFTASFRYINPSVAILLQKLQPILVTLLAILILGERPQGSFYGWAALAIFAGLIISFPNFHFGFVTSGIDLHSKGVSYALIAAGLWGISTIAGKVMLKKTPPSVVTFWRFAFGLLALVGLTFISGEAIPFSVLSQTHTLQALAYMGLVPGLIAMTAYYRGLQTTPATTTTYVELIFPIGAVILNTYFLKIPLDPVQTVGGVLLLVAVTNLSYKNA